jgi:hypothetical protein
MKVKRLFIDEYFATENEKLRLERDEKFKLYFNKAFPTPPTPFGCGADCEKVKEQQESLNEMLTMCFSERKIGFPLSAEVDIVDNAIIAVSKEESNVLINEVFKVNKFQRLWLCNGQVWYIEAKKAAKKK